MLQELLQTVITKKEIKDCNIAAYNNGKTKGYAYVEVTSKEAVEVNYKMLLVLMLL